MKRTEQTNHRTTRLICLILVVVMAAVLLTGCAAYNLPTVKEGDLTVADMDKASTEVKKLEIFDYIKIPFAYLLEWLYNLTNNYGVALILFALIVKILLFPTSALSKKGMMKMSRLTPRVKALEKKYADDKEKYQQEVNKLYREEGAGGCGGCIWSLLPMLILIPLYQILRSPITWLIFHGNVTEATMGEIANIFARAGQVDLSSGNLFYWEVQAMPHIREHLEELKAIAPQFYAMNTKLLGVEMATFPKFMFWKNFDSGVWNAVGQFLLPMASGGINWLSMWVSQKMNETVIVNDKGEQDAELAKQQNPSSKYMTMMMPLLSVFIGFRVPAGLSLYWFVQGAVSLVQDVFLTKHYKKVYDAEDAVKQAKAAEEAAREAELERIRAQKRAENPDGIEGSVSKKKQQQRERNEQAAKDAAYRAAHTAAEEREAELEARLAGADKDRPFSRGRNYDPDRYKKNNKE